MKILVSILLMAVGSNCEAQSEPAVKLPLSIVQHPSGWPLAVLTAMYSRAPFIAQVDTGSRKNILFLNHSESIASLTDVNIAGTTYNSKFAEFHGDSTLRAMAKISMGSYTEEIEVAVIQTTATSKLPRIILGTEFTNGKLLTFNFLDKTLSIEDSATAVATNTPKIRLTNKNGRLVFACKTEKKCNPTLLDTGISFADTVNFVEAHQIQKTNESSLIQLAGPTGAAICTKPKIDENNPQETIFFSECVFTSNSHNTPAYSARGIRSWIDSSAVITLDSREAPSSHAVYLMDSRQTND